MTYVDLVKLEALVRQVEGVGESARGQLAAAAEASASLELLAEELLECFVRRSRDDGMTWSVIGEVLGMSKQAAQSRFGTRHEEQPMAIETTTVSLRHLISGSVYPLSSVQRSTGGEAGVFTIWYREQLLYLGHSSKSADEAKATNRAQADGARGRLVGIRRQPPQAMQRALTRHFPSDVETGLSTQRAVSAALVEHAEYRLVEVGSGSQAADLLGLARTYLADQGLVPLSELD